MNPLHPHLTLCDVQARELEISLSDTAQRLAETTRIAHDQLVQYGDSLVWETVIAASVKAQRSVEASRDQLAALRRRLQDARERDAAPHYALAEEVQDRGVIGAINATEQAGFDLRELGNCWHLLADQADPRSLEACTHLDEINRRADSVILAARDLTLMPALAEFSSERAAPDLSQINDPQPPTPRARTEREPERGR